MDFQASTRSNRFPGLAPQAKQSFSNHWVFQTIAAVQIPAIARTARTSARFMVRHFRTGTRIISVLSFPGYNAALDIDLPSCTSRYN